MDKSKYGKIVRNGILHKNQEYCKKLIKDFGGVRVKCEVSYFGVPVFNSKNFDFKTDSEFYSFYFENLGGPVEFCYRRLSREGKSPKHFLILKEDLNLKGLVDKIIIERL